MITKASMIYGMGDSLNGRAFLVTYCKQKNIPTSSITIYTEKYWWMFEGLGFKRTLVKPMGLYPYKNFGRYDLPRFFRPNELDQCIAMNAQINYSFEVCVPFPEYKLPDIKLPKKFITFNTGYGDLTGNPKEKNKVCIKAWPIKYWEEFVRKIGVPCVQVGAGPSCVSIPGVALDLVNKLTIQESIEVMRRGLFHVDMEGGLAILNQHLGKKSVVLFGPTAIENQGRSFNLNLRSNVCTPCYEWGKQIHTTLYEDPKKLGCSIECMASLTPDFVIQKIKDSGWLNQVNYIEGFKDEL